MSRAPPTGAVRLVEVMRDFGDKVVFTNHLPADDYINAAVDDFSIYVEQGFGFASDFI